MAPLFYPIKINKWNLLFKPEEIARIPENNMPITNEKVFATFSEKELKEIINRSMKFLR